MVLRQWLAEGYAAQHGRSNGYVCVANLAFYQRAACFVFSERETNKAKTKNKMVLGCYPGSARLGSGSAGAFSRLPARLGRNMVLDSPFVLPLFFDKIFSHMQKKVCRRFKT